MVVGGVLQMPLYIIPFVVWRKRKEYLERGRNWTSLERCAKSQLGTTRRKCKACKLAKERLTIVILCLVIGEKFKAL
jgi:hypothetical protein